MLLSKFGEKGKAADVVFSFPKPCAAKIYSSLIIFDSRPGPLPRLVWECEEMSLLYCDSGFPRVLRRPSLPNYCSFMIVSSREQLLQVELELRNGFPNWALKRGHANELFLVLCEEGSFSVCMSLLSRWLIIVINLLYMISLWEGNSNLAWKW